MEGQQNQHFQHYSQTDEAYVMLAKKATAGPTIQLLLRRNTVLRNIELHFIEKGIGLLVDGIT